MNHGLNKHEDNLKKQQKQRKEQLDPPWPSEVIERFILIRGWKVKSARKEDPFANSAENGPEQGENSTCDGNQLYLAQFGVNMPGKQVLSEEAQMGVFAHAFYPERSESLVE
ncbi:hypothetical protein Cadr_000000315 [Camelus dromedarius]|uniref:Uncharacterized protein n=1 Tax=Camelus dromedarius TaxID=9838 RepID=A0A5N4EJM4_CAMDR|nr:hypothetical protein Cadr_000000315 [Camelus dromedarius]